MGWFLLFMWISVSRFEILESRIALFMNFGSWFEISVSRIVLFMNFGELIYNSGEFVCTVHEFWQVDLQFGWANLHYSWILMSRFAILTSQFVLLMTFYILFSSVQHMEGKLGITVKLVSVYIKCLCGDRWPILRYKLLLCLKFFI